MNLLDRISSPLLLIVAAGFFFSCGPDDDILNFNLDDRTTVTFLELELPSRSIFVDSLRTDNESTMVVGRYQDDRFGRIEAEGYTEIRYVEGQFLADSLQYDSLVINLTVNNYVFNDPDLKGSFMLYDVKEELSPSVVYLKDKKGIKGRLLDTMQFELVHRPDSMWQNISVKSNSLGTFLFSQMISDAENIVANGFTTNLAFIPTEDSQLAVTFDMESDSS